MKQSYDIIDHYDVWYGPEGEFVNDSMYVARNVQLDLKALSDRQLYRIFCEHTGYNNRLRAIELDGDYEYYVNITYVSHGHYRPLGSIVASP